MRTRLAIVGLGLLCVTACGTTVPLARQGSTGEPTTVGTTNSSDGLAADSAGAAPGATAGPAATSGGSTNQLAGSSTSPNSTATGEGPAPGNGVAADGAPGAPAATTRRAGAGPAPGRPRPASSAAPTSRAKSGGAPGTAKATAAAGTGGASMAPISIGIVYPDPGAQAAANAALGASVNATINFKTSVEAFIKQINATGGLAGRMIQADEIAETSTADTAPDSECAKFTQDDHVSLVIDALNGGTGDFATCMEKAGAEVIDVVSQTDAGSLAKTPGNVSLFRMTMDRAYGAVVSKLAGSGYVTKQNKIGVLMDTCPNSTAAYNNTVLPMFKSLGLNRVDTVGVDCNGSTASQTSQISGSVLRFRTDDVDRVMIISTSEQTGLLLFSEGAASQGYYPGYMLSSQSESSAVAPLIPAAARDGIHGVGNLPVFDVSAPMNPSAPIEAGCVSDLAKQGVTPSTSDDFYYVYEACAPFRLLARALTVNGGVSTPSVLRSTFAGLGSFDSPGVVGASATLSERRQDGPAQVRIFSYDDSCSCTEYVSAATPV